MRTHRADVAVVGAGPAGLMAALAAASEGARVVLVDSQERLGGQLVKQTHKFFGTKEQFAGTRGIDIARILAERVAREPRIEVFLETQALGVYSDGVLALETGRPARGTWEMTFGSLVVATGAFERSLLFENNDLPGVYGAGAVQTLMNTCGVLPGRRVLMVGSGNIGLIVSYQLVQAGVEVAAVVEVMPRVGGYEVHARRVQRAGVPVKLSTTVAKAVGAQGVEGAVVARVDERGAPLAGTEEHLDVDVICIAVGLSPLVDLLWHSGCRMSFHPELGGYVPARTQRLRVAGDAYPWAAYVAGDAAGIEEASTAMLEGEIAGASAASGDRAPVDGALARLDELRLAGRSARLRVGPARACSTHPTAAASSSRGLEDLIQRARQGPCALIECPEEIACDPCFTACPRRAIRPSGASVVSVPALDRDACSGCGTCVAACPGQAVFVLDLSRSDEGRAAVSVPYELIPLPRAGSRVLARSGEGAIIGEVTVERVRMAKAFDRTAVVTVCGDLDTILATRAVSVGCRGTSRKPARIGPG